MASLLLASTCLFSLRWQHFFTLFIVSGKDSKVEAVPASPVALVAEEKVSFSLYAVSASTLTVAKIRKNYNKLDSKAIAKQVRNPVGTAASCPQRCCHMSLDTHFKHSKKKMLEGKCEKI